MPRADPQEPRDPAAAGADPRLLAQAGFWQSSPGRFHCQTFSPGDTELLAGVEAAWLPLVHTALPGAERSDTQLLLSLPGSASQIFHQDNSKPGLTVLLPLVDMTLDNGPTQVASGQHCWQQGTFLVK